MYNAVPERAGDAARWSALRKLKIALEDGESERAAYWRIICVKIGKIGLY